jgi:hypothetical protein
LTTDELMAEAIEYVRSSTLGDIIPRYMRQFESFRDGGTYIDRFSVALNDETRDVRYVERRMWYVPSTPTQPDYRVVEVFEVRPRTVVRTQYDRVEG